MGLFRHAESEDTAAGSREHPLRRLLTSQLVVRRFWYVLHKWMAAPQGSLAAGGFRCRRATIDDAACFDAFASRRPPEQLRRWVSEADTWVLLAFDGDRPIGYDCVTRRVPAERPFSLLVLSPDEVWVRDVYTVPEYRRLRVRRTLRAHRVRVLRALGYDGYVAAVAEENVSALIATYDDTVATVSGLDYQRILLRRTIRPVADARCRLERLLAAQRARPALLSQREIVNRSRP